MMMLCIRLFIIGGVIESLISSPCCPTKQEVDKQPAVANIRQDVCETTSHCKHGSMCCYGLCIAQAYQEDKDCCCPRDVPCDQRQQCRQNSDCMDMQVCCNSTGCDIAVCVDRPVPCAHLTTTTTAMSPPEVACCPEDMAGIHQAIQDGHLKKIACTDDGLCKEPGYLCCDGLCLPAAYQEHDEHCCCPELIDFDCMNIEHECLTDEDCDESQMHCCLETGCKFGTCIHYSKLEPCPFTSTVAMISSTQNLQVGSSMCCPTEEEVERLSASATIDMPSCKAPSDCLPGSMCCYGLCIAQAYQEDKDCCCPRDVPCDQRQQCRQNSDCMDMQVCCNSTGCDIAVCVDRPVPCAHPITDTAPSTMVSTTSLSISSVITTEIPSTFPENICCPQQKSIARLIKLTKFQKCESVHKLCLTGELCCSGYCITPSYLIKNCCCPGNILSNCDKGSTLCFQDSDCFVGQKCCYAVGCILSPICSQSVPCLIAVPPVKVSDGNTTEISSTVEGQNEFTTTEQSCSSWEEWGACSPTTCLRKRRKSKTLPECLPFSDRELCGDCTTSKGSIQEIKNGLRIKFGKKFMRAVLKNLDLAIEMIVNKVNDFCTENTGYCCESLGKKNSLKIVGKFDITDTSLVKIADGFPQTVDEEAVLKLIFKVKVGSTAKCSSFEVGRAKRAVDEGYVQSTILKLSSESAAEQIKAVLGVPEIELEDPAIEVMTSGIASWLWVTIFVAPIVVVFVITVFVMCCCTRKQTSSKSFRPIEIEILSPGHSGIPPGNFKGSPEYPRETIKQRWYPGNFYSYKP